MSLKEIISSRKSRSWRNKTQRKSLGLFLSFSFLLLHSYLPTFSQSELYKIHLLKVEKGVQKISFYTQTDQWDGLMEFPFYSKQFYWPMQPGEFIKDQKGYDDQGELQKRSAKPVKKMEYGYYDPGRNTYSVLPAFRPRISKGEEYFFNSKLAFGKTTKDSKHGVRIEFNNPQKLYSTIPGQFQVERPDVQYESWADLQKQLIYFSSKPEILEGRQQEFRLWGIQNHPLLPKIYESGIFNELFKIYEANSQSSRLTDIVFSLGRDEKSLTDEKMSVAVYENGVLINLTGKEGLEDLMMKTSLAFSKYWICNEVMGDLFWENPQEPHNPGHLWLIESVSDYLAVLNLLKSRVYSDFWLKETILTELISETRSENLDLYGLGIDLYKQGESRKGLHKIMKNYASFYDRGSLLAFYLDIVLQGGENSDYGIMDWLRIFKNFHEEEINASKNPNPWGAFLKMQNNEVKKLINEYVYGDKPIPHDYYLNRVGWDFVVKGEEHRTFLKGGKLHYFPEIGHYVCVKKGKNTLGMEKGDVIISINNNEVFNEYDLRELIFVSKNIRKELSVKVIVRRKEKDQVLRGKATKKARTKHYELMPDSDPFTDQYRLRKRIFQPEN